jgi:hypothetical protein
MWRTLERLRKKAKTYLAADKRGLRPIENNELGFILSVSSAAKPFSAAC